MLFALSLVLQERRNELIDKVSLQGEGESKTKEAMECVRFADAMEEGEERQD